MNRDLSTSSNLHKNKTPTEYPYNFGMKEENADKRIRIKILEQEGNSQPVFIGVNFKGYTIKRGIEVDVPIPVFEALKNAYHTVHKDTILGEGEERYSYPFQVIGDDGNVIAEYKNKISPETLKKQPDQKSLPEQKQTSASAEGDQNDDDSAMKDFEQAFHESTRLKYIREEIEHISSLPANDHRDYIDRSSSVKQLRIEEQAILDYLAGKSDYSTSGHKFASIKSDDIIVELTSQYQAPTQTAEKNQSTVPEWFINYMNHLADKNSFYKRENPTKILNKLLSSHEDHLDSGLIDHIDDDGDICFSKKLVKKKGAYFCRSNKTVYQWLRTWIKQVRSPQTLD